MEVSELKNWILKTDKGFTKIGYRVDEFIKTPILLGRERDIYLANGDKHHGVFAIVELENILASHNENSFETTKDYPVDAKGENINDRNYKDDKNSQLKVRQLAENFNPDIQISTSSTAAGLPIISIDGVVVSGNNRTMSMKLMVEEYSENYKNYLKTLGDEINEGGYGDFGYDNIIILKNDLIDNNLDAVPNGSIKFKHPILVRIDLDFPEYNTLEMAKYNKDTKKVERPIDKAIKLGKMLESNQSCNNIISEKLSEFENISEFYASSPSVSLIKNNLISCNILTQNEITAYIDKNTFTVAGKEFLENLMAGMILDKEQLIISELEGVKRYKQIIVQTLPVLIKNSKLAEFSLRSYLNDAISIQHKLISGNFTIPDLISQLSMFADSKENFTEKSYYINLLLSTGKNKFKQTIESYNTSAEQSKGATMFGEPVTIDELFDKLIIPKLDETVVKFLKQYFVNKNELIKPKKYQYDYNIGDMVSFIGTAGKVYNGKITNLGTENQFEVKYDKNKVVLKNTNELTLISNTETVTSDKSKLTKEQLNQLIKGLKIQNKYNPNEITTKRLNGLKITFKYLK